MTRNSGFALLALACATALAGGPQTRRNDSPSQPAPPDAIAFCKDIAPVVFSHCAPCHRPGEAAPFSLLTYADVRKHARQIVEVTRSRYMPPWLPEPGFGGMDLEIASEGFEPESHFLFWKPGTVPYVEPDGMSWLLDKRTDLVLNMHLQPSGRPEVIQASVGLYFTDRAPTLHPMLLQ